MSNDQLYLTHILDAIDKIQAYCAEGREKFLASSLVQDAVVRNFEIIGQAAKRLSDTAKALRPDIPWRQITGFRNFLIHDYMGVDPQEVWNVVEQHMPPLRQAASQILESVAL